MSLQVPPGQHINLSLVDFAVDANSRGIAPEFNHDMTGCRVYATVREQGVARSVTVCGGQARYKHIYTSITNMIEIRIVGQDSTQSQQHFLLEYRGECQK